MAYPTNPIYKFMKDIASGEVVGVLKQPKEGVVLQMPIDDRNTDYQEYLKWVADGGVAEAAD